MFDTIGAHILSHVIHFEERQKTVSPLFKIAVKGLSAVMNSKSAGKLYLSV